MSNVVAERGLRYASDVIEVRKTLRLRLFGIWGYQGSGIWVLHKDWRQLLLRYERSVVKEVM